MELGLFIFEEGEIMNQYAVMSINQLELLEGGMEIKDSLQSE